eukprot:1587732-Pyramimonas_sp.AAC.1
MLRPRVHMRRLLFLNQLSGDPPAGRSPLVGHLRGARSTGADVRSRNVPTHVEAQNASETFAFS